MTVRRFTDANGIEWRVRLVVNAPRIGPMHPPQSAQFRPAAAWLSFDSERERRRLSPVPPNWEEAPQPELERLLQLATVMTIRLRNDG